MNQMDGETNQRAPRFHLMCITPDASERSLATAVQLATELPRQSIAIQIRDKSASASHLYAFSKQLRHLTGTQGCKIVINRYVDIALASHADGVQLPERGIPASIAQQNFSRLWVGRSCHDGEGLSNARFADWATLSPFADSPGKAPALTRKQFTDWTRNSPVPVFALGGIHIGNAAEALRSGAHGIAAIRSVFHAQDPVQAAFGLLESIEVN
ncbi:MAG: thiamine phosphate synthase [Myxococcota bacterium]